MSFSIPSGDGGIVDVALLEFANKSAAANRLQIEWRRWRSKYPRLPNVGDHVIRVQGHIKKDGLNWEFYGYHNGKTFRRVLNLALDGMNVMSQDKVFENKDEAKDIQGQVPARGRSYSYKAESVDPNFEYEEEKKNGPTSLHTVEEEEHELIEEDEGK